jgi:EmrB/QacA subfamily drug resistance transporter
MIERMPDAAAPPTAFPTRTLAVASLAVFAVFLDTTVLFVAFPDITASFPDVAPSQLSWVLNGYTIVFAALLVPVGKLADRRGHRSMFLTGSVIFTAASALCAVAPTPSILVATRVLQAVGAAALVPSSLALVLRATPRAKVPLALALWGATGAVAGALGPTLGAALVQAGGWRWVFAVNLPVGIVTVWLGRRVLKESQDPSSVLPAPLGVALLVVASVLVTLGLVRGDDWGWSSASTAVSILAGFAVFGVFLAHQSRTTAPTMDLALFRSRNFAWGNAATMAFGTAFTTMFLSSILFLTGVWGWSILRAGFGIAPGPLLVAVLAPFVGRLAGRVGQRPLLLTGGLVYAAGGLWRLVMLGGEANYLTDYLPSMALTGLGVSLCLPQLSSVVGQALPPNRLGVGGAVNQAIRQFGGTFGVALTVGVIAVPTGLADALVRFDRLWVVIIAGGIATSLLSVPLRTRVVGGAVAPPPVPPVVVPAVAVEGRGTGR